MALTLTTWNLQGHQGLDVQAAASYLEEIGADVVALQEVQKRQARSIAQALNAESLAWAFKHWPIREPSEGMALLGITRRVVRVRVRALTVKRRYWSWRRRIYQGGTVESQDGELAAILVNLHLSAHSEGATAREREVRDVVHTLRKHHGPVVAVGDFNGRPDDRMFEPLVKAGYTSVGGGPTNWHGEPSDRLPDQQLDYIWATGGLGVDKVTLPEHGDEGFARFPGISDHLPLTARLTTP